MGLPDEPRFESGDALYTARGYATDPAVRDGVDRGTEDYNYLSEGFVGGSKGYRTPAAGRRGGSAAHTRGLAPYSFPTRLTRREKAEEAETGEGF